MNNTLQFIMLAILAILAVALVVQHARGFSNPPRVLRLANLGVSEHDTGIISLYADAVPAQRYLLVKQGSDATHFALCGAADRPLGPVSDEVEAIEDLAAVRHLGAYKGTTTMIGNGALAADIDIYTAANGKVQGEPTTAGTFWLVGRSKTACAGDATEFEVTPRAPVKVVVIAAFTAPTTAAGSDAGTTQTLANALKADLTALDNALATPALLKVLAP
jgi:hypothetical protein